MIGSCTISIVVSVIFIVALVLFLVVYVKDKELDHERPTEDNNWLTAFLIILIIGLIVSAYIAYRGYNTPQVSLRKRAFI